MRLVADDDRVGVRDLACVANEPLVGLDRHRTAGGRLAAAVPQERRGDALLVAAVAQLAEELVDEVSAVGEDQDAAGARGLHEAQGGDRLARARGVLDPEAGRRARILVDGIRCRLFLSLLGGIPVERLLVGQLVALDLHLAGVQLLQPGRSLAVAADQQLGLERDQRARQRVDLVSRQRRAVREMWLLLGQQPLQAQHQRELPPPLDRRLRAPRVELLQRRVERGAARAVVRQRGSGVLPFENEGLSREFLGALQFTAGNRRGIGHGARFSHGKTFFGKGGTYRVARQETAGYARDAPPLS